MRLGINRMAWSATVGPAELALFPPLAALGYEGVELPLFHPAAFDPAPVREALQASGLACTLSSALPVGASLLVPDEQPAALAFLRQCLGVARALGASVLCGPLYAPVGVRTGAPPTAAEWRAAVEGLRVVVALEPLNRFETHFLNTAAQACRLVAEVGSPWLGVHLDTFHLNIEEKSLAGALREAGAWLRHVHLSENDRGIVGSGHLPWGEVLAALRAVGYRGWLVCETFNGQMPEIAAATAIWRPLFPDPLTYARESLAFLRRLLPTAGGAR